MKKIILVFCFFSTYAFSQSEVESYLINNIDSIQNAINLDSFGKFGCNSRYSNLVKQSGC